MGCEALQPEPVGHRLLPPVAHARRTLFVTDGLARASVCDHDLPVGVEPAHVGETCRNDGVHGTFPVGVQNSRDHGWCIKHGAPFFMSRVTPLVAG